MAWRWASAVAVALVLFAAPGCTDRACVEVAPDAVACPTRSEALVQMTPRCGGSVISVDSEGEQEEAGLCCYDVTSRAVDDNEPPCAPPAPGVGSGGEGASSVSTAVSVSSSISSSSSSASASSSSGTGGGGGAAATCESEGQACTPACDAPDLSPSAGECVAVGGVVECNPVTNEGCNGSVGEACDVSAKGFSCYPAPNIEDLCQACGGDGSSYCKAGYTCFGTCFRYCCKSSDCGTGVCYKEPFPGSLITSVGVCIEAQGAGGSGGAGGNG